MRQLRECVWRQPDNVNGGRSGVTEVELNSWRSVGSGRSWCRTMAARNEDEDRRRGYDDPHHRST